MRPSRAMASTSVPLAPAAATRGPFRLAVGVLVVTLLTVVKGAMTTSTGSGLAVPDWPLSYGMVFPPMVGGIFYFNYPSGSGLVSGAVFGRLAGTSAAKYAKQA